MKLSKAQAQFVLSVTEQCQGQVTLEQRQVIVSFIRTNYKYKELIGAFMSAFVMFMRPIYASTSSVHLLEDQVLCMEMQHLQEMKKVQYSFRVPTVEATRIECIIQDYYNEIRSAKPIRFQM